MTDKKRPTIPPGYEDEDEFLQEARERFQNALDFDRLNREAAIEDLKFFAGDQWDAEALEARKGRPCLTINTLPQFVAQVAGDIRINRPAIRVRPAEDADKDLADIREGLIRAIERDNDAQGVYAETGQTQVACGIGHFRIGLKYASDDGFDRDITIESVSNPFAVVWDPLSTERTGKDAQYAFVSDEMARKDFEARWKDELPSELEIPSNDANGWYTQDTVRITEYWLMKESPVELALLEGGKVVETSKLPKGAVARKTRKSMKRSACMYLITGKAILSGPHEFPVDRIPILRARGWEVNIQEKRVRFGLVRFARDGQRLKNYWRSVSAEVLAMAPRAQWLADDRAVPEDREDDFRLSAKTGDPLLLWSGTGNEPKRIDPPPVPVAILQEAALNTQDMKDVTGIHDASLGIKSNETSGKAIQARQREGDVASYIYHDNLQAAIKEGGRLVNQLIPVVFDTARTIRVVGEDESTKVQRINDPTNPDSVDINQGRYDVVVETGPSYSTKRVEAAESMMAFFQAVPSAAQVAGDLFAKAQDWPLADEIGERLKKSLPPQLTEDPDEEQTPEQQQAKQIAAQQAAEAQELQRQAAILTVKEQGAKVAKLEAEARKIGTPEPGDPGKHPLELQLMEQQVRKAVAEADKAEAEAAKARAELPAMVATTEAKAVREAIGIEADRKDLERKPLEAAHQEADLDLKLNPPEEPAKAKG